MDRYFDTTETEKNAHEFTKLGRAVCILGKTGIGKTWLLYNSFKKFIELTPEILKSKKDTCDFLEKIRNTNLPVFLDEYECVSGLLGLKELTKFPNEGQFFITSQIPVNFEFEVSTYNFPFYSKEMIKKIVPDATDEVLNSYDGDVRWVINVTKFKSDSRDFFKCTKEFIGYLVSKHTNDNPFDYINHHLSEPGNIASILNSNYLDCENVKYENVSEIFSVSDIVEERIYSGDWYLMPYFNFWGCILPSIEIGHVLDYDIKPGSSWTKFQNMCMRRKKIKTMYERVPHMNQDIDGLNLLISYIEDDVKKGTDLLNEYGFKKEDIDTMNHISPIRKFKPKMINYLKKSINPP